MPSLSPSRRALLDHLIHTTAGFDPPHTFTVVSEWLGYAPFGLYVWVSDLPEDGFPAPWDSGDMKALADAGYLAQLEHEILSDDGLDARTRYRLTPMALVR